MKRFFFFLFLLSFVISACNVTASKQTAESQPARVEVLASPAVQPTLTLIPLAATSTLEIPPPTSAAQASILPTSTLPPPQTLPSNVIQFAAGGTWKDIQDSVPTGGSKVYTLNAMQGQIMSVSVSGGYFPLQIEGRDGTVLCPSDSNSECAFWRGTLPLSQDYYITVISGGMEKDFTLRVAINPKGRAEQNFLYISPKASLSYSDQFAPARNLSTLNNKTELQLSLQLIDTGSYINTNLGEAYFTLGFSSDPQITAACTDSNPNGMPESSIGNVTVNGYNFTYHAVSDVGAGNYYEQHIYRALHNGTCYEVIYFIHSSNIQNYTPGAVKEFDRPGLMSKFEKILSTIQFK